MSVQRLRTPVAADTALKRAVLYLRVSTTRQMATGVDVDAEGNSIATQREYGLVKAKGLRATVEREFIEPGNSALSIEKRPVFRELLAYVQEHHDIDYVIVYMRSRAFRNRIDAAITTRSLSLLGVRIISCREDFGEGYVAEAMEGVSDIFNELQSRQSGEDIKAKLRHKALRGGTIGRAPLGYLNIRAAHEGRLFNSIGLDPERAPLIRHAWELYATGEYSIEQLREAVGDLGLTTRPNARWPLAQPVPETSLSKMLADPYYAGWVTVDGQLIRGLHEPIVTQALFDRVQDVIELRTKRGIRDRLLYHYLKGCLFCERCRATGRTSRLIYTEATGRNGARYAYYLCRARQEGACDLPHLPVSHVERAIEAGHRVERLPAGLGDTLRAELTAAMSERQQLTLGMHAALRAQLAKIDVQEGHLIDLAADGSLPTTKIRERLNSLVLERARIQSGLANTDAELQLGAERLRESVLLAERSDLLYERASEEIRRQLNLALFDAFYLDDLDGGIRVTQVERREPYAEIWEAGSTYVVWKDSSTQPVATPTSVVNIDQARLRRDTSDRRDGGQPRLAYLLKDVFPVGVSSRAIMVGAVGLEPTTNQL
jgi:site-specific DNA recombinase